MKPYVFPECEGCENHRYTYRNKYINYLEGPNETVTRINVEPETHYCSMVGGVYRKLTPSNHPHGCERIPKINTQEVNQMQSTALTESAVATGALTEHRDLQIITSEIHFYKHQAGEAILEIGKRLNEAKEQLGHGEWLDWLRDSVEFSDATAQRFMRLAREYTNPSPVRELGVSKALTLLALPAPERDAFMEETHEVGGEEKTVSDMSKRELEKAVRERAEALRQKAEAEAAAEDARRIADESAAALAAADQRTADAKAEADRLQAEKAALAKELEQVKNADPVMPEEAGQQTMEAIRKEAAKEAKKAAEDKYKKKIEDVNKAQADADKRIADAQAERDRIRQEAEREKAAAAEKIAALEKKNAVASSEAATTFKVHFDSIQGPINVMIGCLMKLKDTPEFRDKLSSALRALCETTIQRLPETATDIPEKIKSKERK